MDKAAPGTDSGPAFARRLRRTADLVRKSRVGEIEREIAEFARAEVTEDDPLRSHRTPTGELSE